MVYLSPNPSVHYDDPSLEETMVDDADLAALEERRIKCRNDVLAIELDDLIEEVQYLGLSPMLIESAREQVDMLMSEHGWPPQEAQLKVLESLFLYKSQLYKKDCRVWHYKSTLSNADLDVRRASEPTIKRRRGCDKEPSSASSLTSYGSSGLTQDINSVSIMAEHSENVINHHQSIPDTSSQNQFSLRGAVQSLSSGYISGTGRSNSMTGIGRINARTFKSISDTNIAPTPCSPGTDTYRRRCWGSTQFDSSGALDVYSIEHTSSFSHQPQPLYSGVNGRCTTQGQGFVPRNSYTHTAIDSENTEYTAVAGTVPVLSEARGRTRPSVAFMDDPVNYRPVSPCEYIDYMDTTPLYINRHHGNPHSQSPTNDAIIARDCNLGTFLSPIPSPTELAGCSSYH